MRRLLPFCLAWLAFAACEDGDDCGACGDGFFVRIGVQSRGTGSWRVLADVDGKATSCTVELPRFQDRVVGCSDPAVSLSLGANETLDTLSIVGTPERVMVVVERDGAEVARQTFEPAYSDVRTAPTCPVACRQASGTITVE